MTARIVALSPSRERAGDTGELRRYEWQVDTLTAARRTLSALARKGDVAAVAVAADGRVLTWSRLGLDFDPATCIMGVWIEPPHRSAT